jgi:hypothetical protein
MRKVLTSNGFLLTLAVAAIALGLGCSILVHDFTCLARSGAILVGISIAFLSRSSLMGQDPKPNIILANGFNQLDPQGYIQSNQPIPPWLVTELKSRYAVGVLGPSIGAAGTVIWGFADLLNKYCGWVA